MTKTVCLFIFFFFLEIFSCKIIGTCKKRKCLGADPWFSFRGVQKNMCGHAHHEREARSPSRPGSRAHLRALEALEDFDALLCYLSLIFKHSEFLIQNGILRNIVDQNLGGIPAVPPPPPLPPIRHWCWLLGIHKEKQLTKLGDLTLGKSLWIPPIMFSLSAVNLCYLCTIIYSNKLTSNLTLFSVLNKIKNLGCIV